MTRVDECTRIVISGHTAAGKTTHAKLIAETLGWQYIGMSDVMRSLLPALRGSREWTPEIDARRADDPMVDRLADARMTAMVGARTRIVVDAWLQPWLCPSENAVKVWLESDLRSRVHKCVVSHLRGGDRPPSDVRAVIAAKDDFTERQFQRLYGISFGYSANVFDLRVENSSYISEPTIRSSDQGIADFQQVLMSALDGLLGRSNRLP